MDRLLSQALGRKIYQSIIDLQTSGDDSHLNGNIIEANIQREKISNGNILELQTSGDDSYSNKNIIVEKKSSTAFDYFLKHLLQ